MNDTYYYTFSPLIESYDVPKDNVEIDLNISKDYQVIFGKDCENQNKIAEFIKSHPDEMNLIAHLLKSTKIISEYTSYDLEIKRLYDEVLNGEYGDFPVAFFENHKYRSIQDTILYYLFKKRCNDKNHNFFRRVITEIFGKNTVFYYDKIKKILFVSFTNPETSVNKEIYSICEYFFADILIPVKPRWNSFPAIIDDNNYIIASEGEQICGTIL